MKRLRNAILILYTLLWVGGVISYGIGVPVAPSMRWTAPTFLALAALLALISHFREKGTFLIRAGLLGLGAEIVGVATGYPFGHYSYTEALGLRLFGVPVVISGAWIVLVAYVHHFKLPHWISAIWLTALDFLIDPLAAGPLGFWRWHTNGPYYGIPWTNFLGWFAVAASIFYTAPRQKVPVPAHRYLGISVVLFFTLIAIGQKMFAVAVIGLLLLVMDIVVSLRARLPWR